MLVANTTHQSQVFYSQSPTIGISEALQNKDLEGACALLLADTQWDLSKDEDVALILLAMECNRLDIAQALIEGGARVNASKDSKTPLMFAVYLNRPDMVCMLLAKDAQVDFVNEDGVTALLIAIKEGNPAMVEQLLNAGADVNIGNHTSNGTPLLCAIVYKRHEVIQILLDAKADVHAYDDSGYAPIHWAYAQRYTDIVALLSQHGAMWNLPTGYEVSEMRFLAASWGIGGKTCINGKIVARDGASGRKPELLGIGHALQTAIPDIARAFLGSVFHPAEHLDAIQNGELVVIETGWSGHVIILILFRGYLAICNRGQGRGTRVYKIDLSRMTRELLTDINDMASETDVIVARDFFYKKLPKELNASRDQICCTLNHPQWHQQSQQYGFCSFNSSEAALFISLALQTVLSGGQVRDAKVYYKLCTTDFRLKFLHLYLEQIENGRLQKAGVDFCLLIQIYHRLINPTWHPERFVFLPFHLFRINSIAQLERLFASCFAP